MAYITKFKDVGSVISSSDQFGNRMFAIAQRHFKQYDRGLFIGTGSGVVAQHFIHATLPFAFIEKHPDFVKVFKNRFGESPTFYAENFFELPFNNTLHSLSNCLIVSCMPVTGMFYSQALVERFAQALDSGSTIVQMGYIPIANQVRLFKELRKLGYQVKRSSTVMLNVPPASIFTLTRPTH